MEEAAGPREVPVRWRQDLLCLEGMAAGAGWGGIDSVLRSRSWGQV